MCSTVKKLSNDLQTELTGLRGFSCGNIKKIRQFYEAWNPYILDSIFHNEKSPLSTSQLENDVDMSSIESQIDTKSKSPLLTNQFTNSFLSVSFTAHYEIIVKAKQVSHYKFPTWGF